MKFSTMPNETRYLPLWMQKPRVSNEEQRIKFIKFKGQINYCTTLNMLPLYVENILFQLDFSEYSEVVYGFDMEWPVTPIGQSRKTALIQICTDHSTVYLFHVFNMPKLSSLLFNLINHPKVRWSGVNIKNDFIKLGRDFDIDVSEAISHIIDLGKYANRVLNFELTTQWSMTYLVQKLLKTNIDKDENIRMGNWNNSNLNKNQLMYAATDAYVSLILYEHLKEIHDKNNVY